MAIDSTMFACKIPAATYAVGDRVPLTSIRGPLTVRAGYGSAFLKRFVTLTNTTTSAWTIHLKNSNWVDEMSNIALGANDTFLGNESGAIQQGNNMPLVSNSGWQVYAECIQAGTEAADADLIALIDVDYPSVSAVQDPKNVQGAPVTIENYYTHTVTAKGAVSTAAIWTTYNVDILKAGYKYLLTEAAFKDSGSVFGFISISGAANQAGLERIIPVRSGSVGGLRFSLDYSTPLVKGPMNLNLLSVGTSGATTAYTYLDFVKKSL